MAERSRPRWALLALIAAIPACGDGTDAGPRDGPTVDVDATVPPSTVVPDGFDSVVVTFTAPDRVPVEHTLWFAGTPEQRRRGLMEVTDLGEPTGMLFDFGREGSYQFYMWQTPMPLDIFFFDEQGQFVGRAEMTPCLDGSSSRCDRYSAEDPFLTAIEMPAGAFDDVDPGPGWSIAYERPADDSTTRPGG